MKKSKITNWILFIPCLLISFGLNAQVNSDVSTSMQTTDAEFPEVISCDCNNSEANCTGVKTWNDGSHYQGEFQYGKLHGKGKLSFQDGSSYEGDFDDEIFHGEGTMVYEDGSKYIGNWVNGYREGQGAFIFPDGSEYLGEFQFDNFHGEGAILLSSGESYSGSWENGLIDGYGTITRQDGSIYFGFNKEGERDGAGMIVYASGDTLHGNWINGNMDQEGIFRFADGSSLISNWENGKMMEDMTYVKSDGFNISAPPLQMANLIINNSFNDLESTEDNLGLAFYAIGMEFKSSQDFDSAEKHLRFAMQFSDPEEKSTIFQMVETQMAGLTSERAAGMAKVNKE